MIRKYPRPAGTFENDTKRKIAIVFDIELFERIADEAALAERPFSEQVRIYIMEGMKALSTPS